jgi:WD40 repeat protein
MKALVVVGSLLLAGCGARSLQQPDGGPPGVIGPGSTADPQVAWLAYADDGLLLAASQDTVVRLDPALNEIDRTRPQFPFDRRVDSPGRMYFSAARDGRVAALSWESDSGEPPALKAGAIVFEFPSAALLTTYSYPVAWGAHFGGASLSPDGKTVAASVDDELLVTSISGGDVWWRANKPFVRPPQFSADGAALVVASDDFAFEVVRPNDGVHLLTIEAPGWHWYDPVAISADGSTLAAFTNDGGILSWRLSDGAPLATATLPSDLGGIPRAIALSPHGDMLAASEVLDGAAALLVWAGDQLLYRLDGAIDALAFSPDGGTLAVAGRLVADTPELALHLLRAGDGTIIAARILP